MRIKRKAPAGLAARIAALADEQGGWVEVGRYRFPRNALIWYALGRSPALVPTLPPYEPLSPPGLKLSGDDRYHTDTWLGAGLDLSRAYDYGGANAALAEAVEIVTREWAEHRRVDFTLLADGRPERLRGSSLRAMVYERETLPEGHWSSANVNCADRPRGDHDTRRAITLPSAGVEHELGARNADLIITEVGGPLAHLSIVSREEGKVLIRVPGAVERFPRFTRLYVSLEEGRLEVLV